MAFNKDFKYSIHDGLVDYRKNTRRSVAALPRSQAYEFEFKGTQGKITLSVAGLDINDPYKETLSSHADPEDPGQGPGGTIETWQHIKLLVELLPPGATTPAASWNTQNGWITTEMFTFTHIVGTAPSLPGKWKCRITNKGTKSAAMNATVEHNYSRLALRTAPVPRVVVDHAYGLILEALTPEVFFDVEGKLNIRFNEELVDFLGDSAGGALAARSIELPASIDGKGRLEKFTLDASTGGTLQYAMGEEWRRRRNQYQRDLENAQARGDTMAILQAQHRLDENQEWYDGWMARTAIDHPCIHANAVASTLELTRDLDLLMFGTRTVKVAELTNVMIDVYLAFDPELRRASTLMLTPAEISGGIVDTLEYFGLIPALNDLLADHVAPVLDEVGAHLGRYLGEAMVKLVAPDSVFLRLTTDQTSWRVQYSAIPTDEVADPVTIPDIPVSGSVEVTPTTPPVPGPMPPEFVLVAPPGAPSRPAFHTQQLDKVEHLVFIMMENRSFDHMLGYLGIPAGSRVDGVRGRHTNPLEGWVGGAPLVPASEQLRDPVTKFFASPYHNFENVAQQVNDGAMDGFAQNFEKRYPGFGQLVMTYYTGAELPVYDQLAREHTICDRWFCAFPGGTWPNRWSTLTGHTPSTENLELDDARIGFLTGPTIFDTLSTHGIEWKVFESDLSLVRTYAKHRLDTTRVVPFYNRYDPAQNFEAVAKEGRLPPVTFVEPNFRDIPPLSSANDDLAPANLTNGQDFIQRVVCALRQSPKWSKTLLLITYDEHGGFFDHVPPPGSPLGPAEWLGKVPPLIAGSPGADRMGVRVPALVVSPLAAAGGVCKQVFDHCSIIKTILLRHRAKFPTRVFNQFGPRVSMAADLGLELASSPPPIENTRTAIPRAPRKLPTAPRAGAPRATPPEKPLADDFHHVLLRGFLPKRKTRIVNTPVSGGGFTRT